MALREFSENDVFVNFLKTKPSSKFSIYNGQVTYSVKFANTVSGAFAALNDLNLIVPAEVSASCSYSLIFSEECNSQYIPLV